MANAPEMTAPATKTNGRRAPKRMSTHIDFTPMVDLAFLLITFFMLTTELQKSNVMALVMPTNEIDQPAELADSKVLTLLLGSNDKIYWYEGIKNPHLDSTDFSVEGIRHVILDKKMRVQAAFGEEERPGNNLFQPKKMVSKLNILIKCTDGSTYKNLVDIFDEMKICAIGHYMLLEIAPEETAFIRNPAAGLQFNADRQIAAIR
jgi:biopolymer transport protein ExbD